MMKKEATQQAAELRERWATDPRWRGVQRDYTPEDVIRLRPSIQVEQTLARHGAERLWQLPSPRAVRAHVWGANGSAGRSDGYRWPAGNLLQRLAGGSRCQSGGADLPRPEPLSV